MLNRTLAPAFSKKLSFELTKPEIYNLSGGINLVYVPGLQQEVVKMELMFKAGKWDEPIPGVSHFTSSLIDKGTIAKSAKEVSEVFDFYGAQIEILPGYDFTSISLYVLKKHLREVLPVFLEVLLSPVFPEDELQLQKEIFIQNLKVNNQKNSFVASKLLRKNIFGETHPYGRSIEESEVQLLNQGDLVKFYKTNFSPSEIYLVGHFDSTEIKNLGLQFSSFVSPKIEEKEFAINPGLMSEFVPKRDSVQSSIRFGKLSVNRLHPDYFSLLLLNHILGGYFGSRLMKSIREEKGLTYGIYSSLQPFKNNCMISIGADVNHDKLNLAKEEIRKELIALKEIPISENELALSKNHLLGNLQLEVANPFAVLEKIKSVRLNELGENYYSNLFSKINSLNVEHILSIAEKYLDPDSFQEVFVG